MPFESSRQLATCYSKDLSAKAKGKKPSKNLRLWDCDKWLKETPNPECLPSIKGRKPKCRPMRKGEKIKSDVYEGMKGGLYFYVANNKVYVPKDAHNFVRKNYKVIRGSKAF
jgi:hypothetical protein